MRYTLINENNKLDERINTRQVDKQIDHEKKRTPREISSVSWQTKRSVLALEIPILLIIAQNEDEPLHYRYILTFDIDATEKMVQALLLLLNFHS